MPSEVKVGATFWIENTPEGEIRHTVKRVIEHQPNKREFCRICHQYGIVLMGSIIQHGLFDDRVISAYICEGCGAVTAFEFHVATGSYSMPGVSTSD